VGLALDLALALDPVLLARFAGLEADPWQRDLLRSTAPRVLINSSRQSGKSTTVAALAVHTALYDPGALVLLLSPSLRQSGELFKKCSGVYQALGRPVPLRVRVRCNWSKRMGHASSACQARRARLACGVAASSCRAPARPTP
jgi:phage terminase large subunit-like protein